MFDVDVGGVATASPSPSSRATRSSSRDGQRPRGRADASATTCAFPSSTGSSPCGALACSSCRPRSRPRPGATTGRCCCGRGRSRTRRSCSPPNQSARRRRTTTPSGARRSSTRGEWCSRRPPTARASSSPSSTSPRQDEIRASLPSLANRRPDAYRWPQPAEVLRWPKAPPLDRRRQILDAAIRVFARQGFNACRVSDIARRGERRLRARLPLLRLEGPGPERALRRALESGYVYVLVQHIASANFRTSATMPPITLTLRTRPPCTRASKSCNRFSRNCLSLSGASIAWPE